jgi:pyrimidine-nucleoside phosphorylase/thymidine phosphorylase
MEWEGKVPPSLARKLGGSFAFPGNDPEPFVHPPEIIRKKRDGQALSDAEIAGMVRGLLDGSVADYQWSALLMAIYFRGMDAAETASLTDAMRLSGSVLDLSHVPGLKVDKHSTGGVGDKTSLILAPIASACGVPVPMVSGRGLGHTGGTLDKLESIPGFNVRLSLDDFQSVLASCGLVLVGQTDEIAPADRILYALRDATSTVESIPLLTASILSKKLAEGIDGLVLDVKTGDGAFMPRLEDARTLAETMTAIGRKLGKKVQALLTRMDQPLGRAVGNAIEVEECLQCLRGEGPDDLMGLSLELASQMVLMAEKASSIEDARALCRHSVEDGSALERFRGLVKAQGGDASVIDDPRKLPQPAIRHDLPAPRSGHVTRLSARSVGVASMRLGAGRARADSRIDPSVGVWLLKKPGDPVQKGEPLCTILANDRSTMEQQAIPLLQDAYRIGDEPVSVPPLIIDYL